MSRGDLVEKLMDRGERLRTVYFRFHGNRIAKDALRDDQTRISRPQYLMGCFFLCPCEIAARHRVISKDFRGHILFDLEITVKAILEAMTVPELDDGKPRQINSKDVDSRSDRTLFRTATRTGTTAGLHVADVDLMLDAALVSVHAIARSIPGNFQESPAVESRLFIVSFVTALFTIDIHLAPSNLFDLVALQLFRVPTSKPQDTVVAAALLVSPDDLRAKVLGGVIIGLPKAGSAVNVITFDDVRAPKKRLTAFPAT